MTTRKPFGQSALRFLATDLDGTFLPLEGTPAQVDAVRRLHEYFNSPEHKLIYITGRHAESVRETIESGRLPLPHLLFCDVGTSLFAVTPEGGFIESEEYRARLDLIAHQEEFHWLREQLAAIEGLQLQEPEKQGAHKLSFYCEPNEVDDLVDQVRKEVKTADLPLSVIGSIDPFTNDGLIDVLPQNVNKQFALEWMMETGVIRQAETLYAGDSGNDTAALVSGCRAVLVGNAHERVRREVEWAARDAKMEEKIYYANAASTEGVLEACRHFGASL
jgi:alpha-amylase